MLNYRLISFKEIDFKVFNYIQKWEISKILFIFTSHHLIMCTKNLICSYKKKQIQRHFLVYQQSYLVLSWKKIIALSNFTEITVFNNDFDLVWRFGCSLIIKNNQKATMHFRLLFENKSFHKSAIKVITPSNTTRKFILFYRLWSHLPLCGASPL